MARVFNGSSQYLERSGAAWSSGAITLSGWFYLPTTTALLYSAGVYTTSSNHFWHVRHVNGQGWGAFWYAGTATSHRYVGANSTVGWHHVAGVWSATNTNAPALYVDGVAISGTSQNGGGTLSVNTTGLGTNYSGDFRGYGYGRLAYQAVHAAVLTADEIADMALTLNGAPCGVHPIRIRPESLVACWPLGGFHGEHDGDIWKDSYNLTAYGSPTWDESPAVIYPSRKKIIFPVSSAAPPSSTKYSWWAWNTFGTPLDHDARS